MVLVVACGWVMVVFSLFKCHFHVSAKAPNESSPYRPSAPHQPKSTARVPRRCPSVRTQCPELHEKTARVWQLSKSELVRQCHFVSLAHPSFPALPDPPGQFSRCLHSQLRLFFTIAHAQHKDEAAVSTRATNRTCQSSRMPHLAATSQDPPTSPPPPL